MGKKLTFFILGFWLTFFCGRASDAYEKAEAFQTGVRDSGSSMALPAIFDILFLVGTFACFIISVRVKSFLRDGELASGWTLFSLSFVLLFAAQLLSLFLGVGLLSISPSLIASLRILFILFLASGIYYMKKVLS